MKVLALSGSARALSLNTKLLKIAAATAEAVGAKITMVSLRDLGLPIYDADLEARDGTPVAVSTLRGLFAEHQGVMFASPEYNGSVTALLKNSLDWCSRPHEGKDGLLAFRGKPAVLLSASPSPFGGIRGVGHLRGILSKMGMHVLPDEIILPFAPKAFAADGALVDSTTQSLILSVCQKLVGEGGRAQPL